MQWPCRGGRSGKTQRAARSSFSASRGCSRKRKRFRYRCRRRRRSRTSSRRLPSGCPCSRAASSTRGKTLSPAATRAMSTACNLCAILKRASIPATRFSSSPPTRGVNVHGFHGRLLHIDLSRRESSWHELEAGRLRAFLGGIGLGASLLYEWAPPGVDPFAPENPLIFASAPLVGTGLTTTAKFAVVTKSPLTGFAADSLSSSHCALALTRAGIDALVVTGRAESLSYVFVDRGRVEFHNAEQLRGKSPLECESRIRAELANPSARIAAIGKAGENKVSFATISNEGRHAGRGGVGAVMGSKNLKAVVLRGD